MQSLNSSLTVNSRLRFVVKPCSALVQQCAALPPASYAASPTEQESSSTPPAATVTHPAQQKGWGSTLQQLRSSPDEQGYAEGGECTLQRSYTICTEPISAGKEHCFAEGALRIKKKEANTFHSSIQLVNPPKAGAIAA